MAGHPEPQRVRIVARVGAGVPVQLGQGLEPLGLAEDRQVQRPAVAAGAHDAGGGAADGDPHRQLALDGPGVDAGVDQRRAVTTGPRDLLVAVELDEQVQLLLEQLVVVGQVVAEQREGLGVGTASGGDLGPSAGDEVDGGEVLQHLHRIGRGQHGDRARQPDLRRGLCDGGQDDRG